MIELGLLYVTGTVPSNNMVGSLRRLKGWLEQDHRDNVLLRD
jgi:hypothetical protein